MLKLGLLFLLVRFPFLSVLPFSKAVFTNIVRSSRFILSPESAFNTYSLSQNGWDTLGSPCPLNVGVQDLVTKPR